MAKLINLVGNKYDKLLVLEKAPSRKRHTYWKCLCDCGNICEVSGEYLKREGLSRSCGCHLKKNIKEKEKEEKKNYLVGKKFGKLTVLENTGKSNSQGILWRCKCECGNEKIVSTQALTSHHTRSCGCLKLDSHLIDLTNKQFGKLIALYYIPNTKKWHCKCECGNEKDILGDFLRKGLVQSCGCINYSIGERNIENILKENNIIFKREYSFPDLINLNTKRAYRYDFALFKDNNLIRLVEFDGEQHFNPTRGTWKNHEPLNKVQERDKIKNNYALKHKIPLVRIPYFERDTITLEKIMGDQFLIAEE